MHRTDVIVIGGGQAGLAISRCLADRAVDHVVLERGRMAERWRSERWDSLRLLTPNWQSRLPGFSYQGPDPDGFMSVGELLRYFETYAATFTPPIRTETTVLAIVREDGGYVVRTDRGDWAAPNVVMATGWCDTPSVPGFSSELPDDIHQVVPSRYRNPGQLAEGGVLVVGASATGLQLAEEIHASGRPVTLATSHHTRMPRSYRGRDIMWWLDRTGIFSERVEDLVSLEASRAQPSLQLVGRPDHRTLDLGVLQAAGVRLVGRALAADGRRIKFADDLADSVDAAQAKLRRVLGRIDAFIADQRMSAPDPEALPRIRIDPPPAQLDLRAENIRTVLWATGYRRRYRFLEGSLVGLLDRRGELRHVGGVTPMPGLYALGLFLQRRRNSSFIDGVGEDARELADRILARLRRSPAIAA